MTAITFKEYRARKVLNIHKHVDGPWFWDKYSAHPYVGCANGCAFCYARGGKYVGRRDPEAFDTEIKVKTNAAELLKKELAGKPHDVIACGDWQHPAEERYRLSRAMLEVIADLGFPLFIVERSPLLVRDMDLLKAIEAKSWVGVAFSISNMDPDLKTAFEPRSPSVRQRLRAMAALAANGITTGSAMMPVLPLIGDSDAHLAAVIQATRDHGGSFVMAGGMTMDGIQAQRTLDIYDDIAPEKESALRQLYQWDPAGKPTYGPLQNYGTLLGLKVRDLCAKIGIRDRMPRYIPAGPLAANKRIAELLFLKTYELELEGAANTRIWAYRRAAWIVDEWPESIEKIYGGEGSSGLKKLPGIGERLAGLIGTWLQSNPSEGA